MLVSPSGGCGVMSVHFSCTQDDLMMNLNLTLITLQNADSPGEGPVSEDKEGKKEGE